jgi:cell division protein FtsB
MLLSWLTSPIGAISEAKVSNVLRTQVESLTLERDEVWTKASELQAEKDWLKAKNAELQAEIELLKKQNQEKAIENENLRKASRVPRASMVFRWEKNKPIDKP